jgi:hypothetical protein
VSVPNGQEGVRIDGGGHVSIRNISCVGSSGSACVTIQRQSGVTIENLSASGVTNALVVPWENGWTQFPVTLRNSNLLAGVYFQGRIYLNSVNNIYPAKLKGRPTFVKFGAYLEGNVQNDISYGGLSDIFSCNDIFKDTLNIQPQSIFWSYTGPLLKPVRYCN